MRDPRRALSVRPVRRPLVVVGLLVARLSLATPAVGAPVNLDLTAGQEPCVAYASSTGLGFSGRDFALWWNDDRSGTETSWVALIELDGGVRAVGNRPLSNVADFRQHGQVGLCPWGTQLLWVTPEDYSGQSSLIVTTLDVARISRTTVARGEFQAERLACGAQQAVWLHAAEQYFPSDFSLELDLLTDGGVRAFSATDPLVAHLHVLSDELQYEVGWRGSLATVVWTDGRNGALPDGGTTDLDVYGATYDLDTAALSVTPRVTGMGAQADPHLDQHGPDDFFLWSSALAAGAPRALYFRRGVSPATLLTSTGNDHTEAQVVWDGAGWQLAWLEQLTPQDSIVWTATVSVSGTVSPHTQVHRGFVDQLHLATDGAGHTMVAWRDFERGIHLVGLLLPPGPGSAAIDPTRTGLAQHELILFGDATSPLGAAWVRGGVTHMKILSTGVTGTTITGPVRIAGSGARLMVVGADWRGTFHSTTTLLETGPTFDFSVPGRYGGVSTPVWGRGFNSLATIDDLGALRLVEVNSLTGSTSSRVIVTGAVGEPSLALGPAGTRAVAWDREGEPHVTCVFADAGVSAAPPLEPAGYSPRTRVASDGQRFFAIYQTPREVHARFLDDTCTPVGPALALGSTDFWSLTSHSLLWDGAQFVVTFTAGPAHDPAGDIQLVTVALDGGVSAPLDVAAQPLVNEQQPVVASEGPGQWVVGYERFDDDEAISAMRVLTRSVQALADAGPGDAGGGDAGPQDGGEADAGTVDAGATDAGEFDAGAFDAGTSDAGGVDAGTADGGEAPEDAGPMQARRLGVGCGCGSGELGLLWLGLLLIGRRGRAPA